MNKHLHYWAGKVHIDTKINFYRKILRNAEITKRKWFLSKPERQMVYAPFVEGT